MDEFDTLARDFGFRPNNNSKSASVMADFDYDAIFKNSASVSSENDNNDGKSNLNSNFPLYDDDIFVGFSGSKSKSMSSSGLPRFKENVFVSPRKLTQQSDNFDEFLGSLSGKQKGEIVTDDSSQSSSGFDDLIPGFGSGNAAFNNRSSSEPTSKSTENTKETSNAMDDPFVVLESTSSTNKAYQSFSTDSPEDIGSNSKSGTSQSRGSSVSGDLFENIDPLNGFGNSAPEFTSEKNNRGKDQSPPKEGQGMGRAQSSISKNATHKALSRYSESRSQVTDFQESNQTVFGIPEVSRIHNRSFDQSTSPPSYDTSSQMCQRADEIWLTVLEIPLFTQPTRALPPLRPPPPVPRHIPKPERVSLRSNSRKAVNGFFSSPKFATSRISNDSGDYTDSRSAVERDSTIAAAAAMKDAMDRAEAKFRHAKEVRERENAKASRNQESVYPGRDEQREKEEEEREKRRLEKERIREIERQKARQAVERATREARERAAFEARERASVEARLKSERDTVQRAQAEARERAAVGARDRADRAATEAKQKAEEDLRRRAERAAVEQAASESRKRAAVDARERAASSRLNQQTNDNELESLFSNRSRPSSAPRPRETSSDSASDPLSRNRQAPEGAHWTSTTGVSSNMRKASSTTNIVDDLSSIFGAGPTSGQFQEVEGETEERRRARLEREQRTQERTAKALAEKNLRDLQSQREQEERHRFGETLDTEVKRWAAGKEGNLRALLSTLQYVLWPECGWQPVSLSDLITGANVKKAYRKATLCIHPDKVQQKGANLQQKYVAEKVFDILKEAWNKFNSDELF